MRHLIFASLLLLVGCGRAPDPERANTVDAGLVDNTEESGLISANAQNAELSRQAKIYRNVASGNAR